jgi:DNA-binding response OmpR family regulator
VLVVEDDARMAAAIRRGLRYEGLVVDVAADGQEALARVGAVEYEAVVLDVMLPGMDGVETCRRLRERAHWVPVLMLTARDAVEDRIIGLDAGADDYLTKPFHFGELLARIRAVTRRRARPPVPERIACGRITLDTRSQQVWVDGQRIELTAREYVLLEYFCRKPGAVISREELAENVWDDTYDRSSNVIDVYIQRLRRKLGGEPESPIRTRRGAGYQLIGQDEGAG